MTATQEQLLSLLSNALFGNSTRAALTPELSEEARAQTVSTIIGLDYPVLQINILIRYAHAELTSVLAGIPFTTFKGFASAYYYPKPALRGMGDVDFITEPAYYDEAADRLLQNGWTAMHLEHDRHEAFMKNDVCYELHVEMKGLPNGVDGIPTDSKAIEQKVHEMFSDLIETAVTVNTQFGPVVIPDDFHHGLIMLLHVAGHMYNDGGVGLRHLCDWAVYVNRVPFGQFKDLFQSIGLWTFACQLTACCTAYLGLPKQEWAGEWPESFLRELIEDILAGGNFGLKEVGRREAMTVQHRSFAEITRKRFPQAQNPLLLPFFMAANAIRYGWLIVSGRRMVIKPSAFSDAKKRNKLYQQFRLFEAEQP